MFRDWKKSGNACSARDAILKGRKTNVHLDLVSYVLGGSRTVHDNQYVPTVFNSRNECWRNVSGNETYVHETCIHEKLSMTGVSTTCREIKKVSILLAVVTWIQIASGRRLPVELRGNYSRCCRENRYCILLEVIRKSTGRKTVNRIQDVDCGAQVMKKANLKDAIRGICRRGYCSKTTQTQKRKELREYSTRCGTSCHLPSRTMHASQEFIGLFEEIAGCRYKRRTFRTIYHRNPW